MTERNEKVKLEKIVFFDADNTLWRVVSETDEEDYASKGAFEEKSRTFVLTQNGEVTRMEDGTKLILKEGVVETLERLAKEGVVAGIISDNIYEDVEEVSQLLGIWNYFDKGFVKIRFWKGPADKNLMISEVLSSKESDQKLKVLLVDDGEGYGVQMSESEHNFILSPKDTFPKDSILKFFGIK